MNTLSEAEAVALLLEHRDGYVHVYADGSANWSPKPPSSSDWPFAEDCPEALPVRKYSYPQARLLYRGAIKRLRARGVYRAD